MARAHGIDISKWQISFDASVNPDDIQFVIQRASVGVMTDSKFEEFNKSIRPIPVRGAYHYFRSEWEWQEQAEHFLNLVKNQGFHFYALDLESADNERSKQFAQDAKRWIDRVAKKTGKRVLLYTNLVVYNTWLTPFANWMSNYPLWIAQYWFEPDRNKKPALPDGVTEWTFWQYSADGNNMGALYGAGSKHLDLDVFNGTTDELYKWLGLKKAAKPKPAPTGVKLPADIDYDLLADKLAPLVATRVAELLKKAPGAARRKPAAGLSFGLSETPVEEASLESVNGIGPALASKFQAHGVRNLRALAFLGTEEVCAILNVSESRARGFVDEARRLEGVG